MSDVLNIPKDYGCEPRTIEDIKIDITVTSRTIETLKIQLYQLNKELECARKDCKHDWGEATDTRYNGHGPDLPPPVPSWARTCNKCGHAQTTEKFRIVKTEPVWD